LNLPQQLFDRLDQLKPHDPLIKMVDERFGYEKKDDYHLKAKHWVH
jgi:hypothetical protein